MQHMPWTREQYREMDLRAQARLLKHHPEYAGESILAAFSSGAPPRAKPLITYSWGGMSVSATVSAPEPSRIQVRPARQIIYEVCDKHRIPYLDVISARRDHRVVLARQEAMYRLRHETTLSTPQIGRMLGDRDHTTVLHGVKRHESRTTANRSLGANRPE